MKTKNILLLAVVISSIFTSCKKDFLDEEPTEFVSYDELTRAAKDDPSLLNGSIAGLYVTMYNTVTGGTTGHDDFGQKGYDIYSDMLSGDMVLAALNYGWYSTIARLQATVDYTRNEDYMPWRYYYRIILGANIVLDAQGGDTATLNDDTKRFVAGQAKAMRGYALFYLSQLYAKGYNPTEKILPIYRSGNQQAQPKSTTEQVYKQIIGDLEAAVVNLDGFERTSKEQIDADVARGLLAYALAARGTTADLNRVITLTDSILNVSGYPLTDSLQAVARFSGTGSVLNPQSGFNNVATPSWMWGVDLTLASNLDLVSWWGQVDLFTYSYAWAGDPKTMDRALQTAIRADDIRKSQFSASGRPSNKFFDPARVQGGQRNVTTDYIYMRADEMLLLNAEAKARLGLDNEARETLKELLKLRIKDYSYVDALSGTALLNEIYFQTRAELWGEGKSYLAMKRLKKSVVRGSNHLFFPNSTMPWDDPRLTFTIPQAEVLNNPVLNN